MDPAFKCSNVERHLVRGRQTPPGASVAQTSLVVLKRHQRVPKSSVKVEREASKIYIFSAASPAAKFTSSLGQGCGIVRKNFPFIRASRRGFACRLHVYSFISFPLIFQLITSSHHRIIHRKATTSLALIRSIIDLLASTCLLHRK